LGRKFFSPWPKRIDIKNIQRISENKFLVEGEVIEKTSVEAVEGKEADRFSITLTLEKRNSKWVIVNINQESNQISVPNPAFDFCEKRGREIGNKKFQKWTKRILCF
jgi:putative hemolysin